MKRILTLGASLALMLGFASCQKNNMAEPTPNGEKGDTYVGLSLQFPTTASLKAAPEKDYNPLTGEWKGRDKIKSVTVYLVTEGVAVTSQHFTKANFHGIDENGVLNPTLAVEAVAGHNVKAYVVVNDVNGKITGALNTAGWALGAMVKNATKSTTDFETEFKKALQLVNVSDVAITDTDTNTDTKDIIVMTNSVDPVATAIQPSISAENAKAGVANLIKVNLLRVASRAIVTIDQKAKKKIEVKRTNTETGVLDVVSKVKITSVEYAATGSAIQLNPIQPAAAALFAPKGIHDFTPGATYWTDKKGTSGVSVDGASVDNSTTLFTYADPYATVQDLDTAPADAKDLANVLKTEEVGKFLLPVTHANGNYKKGNTPFFTIRVTFTAYNKNETGTFDEVSLGGDGNIYYGKLDGKFYTSENAAKHMTEDDKSWGGEPKQDAVKYVGGVMFYNIWINPNEPYSGTDRITMSPVYRNQVYHAHITGFKELGLNWTPNKDPKKPNDPDNPGDDPDNPFKPDDPLETDKTYLSVQLKVLNYTMHSYTVDLGNRY